MQHLLLAAMYGLIVKRKCCIVIFIFLQTRKFKDLLESNLGWEFQQSSAVDGLYFDENDEVSVYKFLPQSLIIYHLSFLCLKTLVVLEN